MIQSADTHDDPHAGGEEPDLLPVRMLTEYAYCPRLFHLMHVEGRWADNAYTVEGRNVHRRADRLDHVLPDPQSAADDVSDGDDDGGKGKKAEPVGEEPPTVTRSVMLGSATLGLTGKVAPYKTGFGPFPSEIFHAQFPNAAHGVSVDDSIASVESIFKNDIEASRVAAIIVEPVQGEGGFNVAPTDFLQRLRALCDQHGILLIADEIQTGAGRTGTWFAIEQSGVAPDMITMAKSMAGGYPISGVVGRAEVMDAPAAGGLGGTYAGSPIACAAALAVLDVFEKENLLARSRTLGAHMMTRLKTMAAKDKRIADVRGLGAMVAIELCRDGDPHQPNADLAKALAAEATKRGLILLTCGTYGNVVRILVPLTASDAIVDEGLAIIEASMAALQIA